MNRDHVPLTEAEWKIMLLLWEKSPRTMMELTRALAEDTGWSKHTAVSYTHLPRSCGLFLPRGDSRLGKQRTKKAGS